ncbi:MAG: cell division protein SepF [Clostridia bacterium]|nr:cell division protein SepF [Clostridia bacterium]
MARKQSGGLNKLLNFIGLVDDEDSRDTYGEEYASDSYGRKAAYTPARQPSRPQGRAASSRQSAQRSLPQTSSRSRYESRYESRFGADSRFESRGASAGRSTRAYDDYRPSERRAQSRFDDSGYDARPQRQSSRYSQQPDARYSAPPAPRATPQRSMRVSQRSRTVMYSLHSLEDCCEVIDQLIANNTVVLTMDELDGRLLQRAVDTLSGAVFALHASIRKASDKTYLVAPMSVEVNEAYDLDKRF